MLRTWHECRIRYERQDENDGKIKRVSESYLVEALTYTEVETRLFKEQGANIHGEYLIPNIKRARYAEVIPTELNEDNPWFNCKYTMTILNEVSGKEQKVAMTALVQAEDCADCLKRFGEYMRGTVSDVEITAISKSPIVACYKAIDDDTVSAQIEQNSAPVEA